MVIDAGNDDWGTWTQILGSTDTPTEARATHYDFHLIHVTTTERTAQRYMFQIAFQEDAPTDDPSATDVYTEEEFTSSGIAALSQTVSAVVQTPRVPVATKAWMRARAPNADTGTMSFYFGLHEYFDRPDVRA